MKALESTTKPDWAQNRVPEDEIQIDMKRMVRNGLEPLPAILEIVSDIRPTQILHLVHSHEPILLYEILTPMGFEYYAEPVGGLWHCYFKKTPGKVTPLDSEKSLRPPVDPDRAVGQMAVERKEVIPIFEKYGINYYSEGHFSLTEACGIAGVDLDKVLEELSEAPCAPGAWAEGEPDWSRESMASMIEFIVHVYHAPTREKLSEIEAILAKCSREKMALPRLNFIQGLFLKLDVELRDHFRVEEVTVFPFLIRAERALQASKNLPPLPAVSEDFVNPIRALLFEHGMMDREFKELAKLIFLLGKEEGDWKLIAPTLEELFQELDKDNEKHIHMENNVLLKRASQMGLLD